MLISFYRYFPNRDYKKSNKYNFKWLYIIDLLGELRLKYLRVFNSTLVTFPIWSLIQYT